MGTKYTSTSSSGYNASPPSDDGTEISTNEIKWSFIKSKLSDVLKTFIEAVNTKLVTHFDESVLDKAVAYTTVAADHKRTINITALATQKLGDAATMGVGYIVIIKNSHSATNTVGRATGANTIDGTAGDITLAAGQSSAFIVNAAADGYFQLDTNNFDALTATTFTGALVGNADTVTTNANLTGEITSSGNAATLDVTAITGKTALTSGLATTDELVLSDGGVIKRMDISVLTTHMNENVAPEGGGQNLQTKILTTSGTSHEFSSIPSWVTKIQMMFDSVSTNTTQTPEVRIGDSGGLEGSGYLSTVVEIIGAANPISGVLTTGFEILENSDSGTVINGIMTILKQDSVGNIWVANWTVREAVYHSGVGIKTLTGTLDRIALTLQAGAFDAGSVSVTWE